LNKGYYAERNLRDVQKKSGNLNIIFLLGNEFHVLSNALDDLYDAAVARKVL
jgi:hypothetical protein